MATQREGKIVAQEGRAAMTADYGQRAASALDALIPGPHRDKAVARLFGVSVRFAKYLRAGQHWTTDRLTEASAKLGVAFDAALYSPVSSAEFYSETADFEVRLARLEARLEEMVGGGDAGLAREPEAEAAAPGGTDGQRQRGTRTEDGRPAPQHQGPAVAGTLRAMGEAAEDAPVKRRRGQ